MKKKLNCILLVDDDEPTNFLHEMVISDFDCTEKIVSVQDGNEALEYLKSSHKDKPDLIFLDINMPGMNGWEFLEAYQHLEEKQKVSVVVMMLTTSLNPDDEIKAKKYDLIHGYKKKPLTEEILKEIIHTYFPDKL
ncbi:response regulator [Flexithrix dorotheae]|uniref:response regulator n=1 Tax=Flexithrix dorotheae TaxID=70993 RepID=UPI0003645936|nr:response regulator [Flexithrix dorotheae]